jgi:Transposase DDE domain
MSEANVMDEDWELLLTMMPVRWRELAGETKALKGLRKDKGAADLLRTLLLHLACGYSLRETAVRAREARLADLSDVAVLLRLRKSKDWLHGLCRSLLEEAAAVRRPLPGLSLRLVDATHVQEPGPTGSNWRIHYSLRWPELSCDHFQLTAERGRGNGESLTHFPVAAGDHLIADRGYSNFTSVQHVVANGGIVTVRLNPKSVRLKDPSGDFFALRRHLRRIKKTNEVGCWQVELTGAANQTPIPGRLCVVRKSQAAIAEARRKAKRSAQRDQRVLKADTLHYAEYVMVFTTVGQEQFGPHEVLEIYRLRWQIELVFKRFKQLAHLGHLPKEDEESSKAWLYGKLFVALLTERLVRQAESLSPWGYEVAPPPEPEPLARV